MKIIGKFGLAALDAGAVWSVCLSGSAQTPDIFTKHVMARPKIDRLKPKRLSINAALQSIKRMTKV